MEMLSRLHANMLAPLSYRHVRQLNAPAWTRPGPHDAAPPIIAARNIDDRQRFAAAQHDKYTRLQDGPDLICNLQSVICNYTRVGENLNAEELLGR
jgi:hypothetical protein